MSWIKDNKFLVALGGGTLVAAILLYFAGSKLGGEKYEAAKTDFDTAAGEASSFEGTPLYPRPENVDSKTKALNDYRKSAEALQATFEPFRPKDLKNVSPQEFTDHLKAVNDEVRKAFEEAGTGLMAFLEVVDEVPLALVELDR